MKLVRMETFRPIDLIFVDRKILRLASRFFNSKTVYDVHYFWIYCFNPTVLYAPHLLVLLYSTLFCKTNSTCSTGGVSYMPTKVGASSIRTQPPSTLSPTDRWPIKRKPGGGKSTPKYIYKP